MGEQSLKLHEKVAEDSDKLFRLFEEQNWKDLNNLMGSFEDVSSEKDVISQIHPLLINRDPVKYLTWLKNTRVDISNLSDKAVKNIVSKLINKR